MSRRSSGLNPVAQRAALTALTAVARTTIGRRRTPLPQIGHQEHLTAVVRLGAGVVPPIELHERHYSYPAETVHVTVSNLDAATIDVSTALRRLSAVGLEAPEFVLEGGGCSPDTLFVRCVHDDRFSRLRDAVTVAFGVERPRSPTSWLLDQLSFANVVRFDGPGQWVRIPDSRTRVECFELEIVLTDRFLSAAGTTILGRVPLEGAK